MKIEITTDEINTKSYYRGITIAKLKAMGVDVTPLLEISDDKQPRNLKSEYRLSYSGGELVINMHYSYDYE